jgi:thiol-disulfide isomerase/thioredoxin
VKNGVLKPILESQYNYVSEYMSFKENDIKEFIGHTAPDFTLTDIDGKQFSLSAFDTQEKYIVLDFWGSWCSPCIHGMPEMKRVYEKYRDKLEIVGIACNDKEADWKTAVIEHELLWIQTINVATVESSISVRYAIDSYPTKIILSPDKTFLFKFEGEGDDFYRKLDELLK